MPATTVTITEESGKYRMTGTTYIVHPNNTVPWTVNVLFDTEAQALAFATAHGYIVS